MSKRLSSWLSLLLPRRRAEWSIGIYAGEHPARLRPHRALPAGLAISPGHVAQARGVADPFLVFEAGRWFLFFELENDSTGRGEIALATSSDGVAWKVEGTVLKEPFHLSYPHVFHHEGRWYMIPESAADRAVRLYVATAFPFSWQRQSDLLLGDYVDATPFAHDGRWWMFALQDWNAGGSLMLFHAPQPQGPWQPHPLNPILSGDRRHSRPAGRVLRREGCLLRLAQDSMPNYGRCVRAFSIKALTPQRYEEEPFDAGRTWLDATGRGWNATGMHHLDAIELAHNQWIAAVDGRRTRLEWPVAGRLARLIRGAAR